MLEQRIQRQFFESADLQYQAAEALARPVAQAAESVIGAFTSGASLLVCGQEGGQSLARHAAHVLLGQLERQRPPLAALAIEADPRAIQALGQPGGVLLIVDPLARATEAEMTLIGAAHDKDMSVILLAGRDAGALSDPTPGRTRPCPVNCRRCSLRRRPTTSSVSSMPRTVSGTR